MLATERRHRVVSTTRSPTTSAERLSARSPPTRKTVHFTVPPHPAGPARTSHRTTTTVPLHCPPRTTLTWPPDEAPRHLPARSHRRLSLNSSSATSTTASSRTSSSPSSSASVSSSLSTASVPRTHTLLTRRLQSYLAQLAVVTPFIAAPAPVQWSRQPCHAMTCATRTQTRPAPPVSAMCDNDDNDHHRCRHDPLSEPESDTTSKKHDDDDDNEEDTRTLEALARCVAQLEAAQTQPPRHGAHVFRPKDTDDATASLLRHVAQAAHALTMLRTTIACAPEPSEDPRTRLWSPPCASSPLHAPVHGAREPWRTSSSPDPRARSVPDEPPAHASSTATRCLAVSMRAPSGPAHMRASSASPSAARPCVSQGLSTSPSLPQLTSSSRSPRPPRPDDAIVVMMPTRTHTPSLSEPQQPSPLPHARQITHHTCACSATADAADVIVGSAERITAHSAHAPHVNATAVTDTGTVAAVCAPPDRPADPLLYLSTAPLLTYLRRLEARLDAADARLLHLESKVA